MLHRSTQSPRNNHLHRRHSRTTRWSSVRTKPAFKPSKTGELRKGKTTTPSLAKIWWKTAARRRPTWRTWMVRWRCTLSSRSMATGRWQTWRSRGCRSGIAPRTWTVSLRLSIASPKRTVIWRRSRMQIWSGLPVIRMRWSAIPSRRDAALYNEVMKGVPDFSIYFEEWMAEMQVCNFKSFLSAVLNRWNLESLINDF